mgnify:CR=1 FL=1
MQNLNLTLGEIQNSNAFRISKHQSISNNFLFVSPDFPLRQPTSFWEVMVGAVGKVSAFQPQGPQFDPPLCQDLSICRIFFSA